MLTANCIVTVSTEWMQLASRDWRGDLVQGQLDRGLLSELATATMPARLKKQRPERPDSKTAGLLAAVEGIISGHMLNVSGEV
jgi:hypothetical protein